MIDIWPEPKECACESSGINYEKRFLNALCEIIVDNLRITWTDKRIVEALLNSSIEDEVSKLLEQYLHSQLEIISREINNEFRIEEKPCYNYATHAKLNKHIDAIKHLLSKASGNE